VNETRSHRENVHLFSQEISTERWTVEISWRDFTRTRGSLDHEKVHGGYRAGIRSSKLKRKWCHRSGVTGTVRSHATSHIGISQVGVPSCGSRSSDITKGDTPTISEPLIMGARVIESQYLGVRGIGVLDNKERLHRGFTIREISR
jgi:hypothetical protein